MSEGIPPDGDDGFIRDDDYRKAFGEDLADTLDLRSWDLGFDPKTLLKRFKAQIGKAVEDEDVLRDFIRKEFFPRLRLPRDAPPSAGVYPASPERLATIHEGLLFPGRVEAVNSVAVSHDSLPIAITQIGVAIVSYGGNTGVFSQRLFRKEMSTQTDARKLVREIFEQRRARDLEEEDTLSKLARRNIRAHAELALLLDRSNADWRMGYGNPCSRELLSGSGYSSLLTASLELLKRLIRDQQKFVFVPNSLEDRGFLTFGNALYGGEYAIIDTLEEDSAYLVEKWNLDDDDRKRALKFVREYCPNVLRGIFRASDHSPPYLFYAHREHVHVAAHVAMADSILRSERGFPMLLDVADVACRGAFGSEGFLGMVNDAYAQAGAKFHYASERKRRP
ncbi:hypothetical protein [Melittangium boletus]|uniref:Uncharacterized protein n=1 Tax=Melittangium boletus DSM 14713 TaxID=1294270 RepID=A0A250IRQ3_9BACT|nr:hypothetical protein [Melittangium boletus]ATB34435.1 hypothetical protein MEBOL_007938 [Melittangium boletus DSM 14713]